jgi:hypothetical protein
VAFVVAAAQPSTPAPAVSASSRPTPSTPAAPDTKRKVETGLTAAAIAAIIVQASRDSITLGQAVRLS